MQHHQASVSMAAVSCWLQQSAAAAAAPVAAVVIPLASSCSDVASCASQAVHEHPAAAAGETDLHPSVTAYNRVCQQCDQLIIFYSSREITIQFVANNYVHCAKS